MARPGFPLALALATVGAGIVLTGILALEVIPYREQEYRRYQGTIIQRDADVLYPIALQQVAAAAPNVTGTDPMDFLQAVLQTAETRVTGVGGSGVASDMFAVAVFDADGNSLTAVPSTLILPEIPPADLPQLLNNQAVSHYYPDFPFERYFAGARRTGGGAPRPVLEVILPLHLPIQNGQAGRLIGFVQYLMDARPLTAELTTLRREFDRETATTLAWGALLIGAVLAGAYVLLARAQRTISERTERLARSNFELALAAKVSALGQITSHLIHGLQGPVAGLRAVLASHSGDAAVPGDWRSAAEYTERLQALVQETVELLGDIGGQASYELGGLEIAETIQRRNARSAAERRVTLAVTADPRLRLDGRRAGLLCLIATNLAQNAIGVSPPEGSVSVSLRREDGTALLRVEDAGGGIPPEIRAHLFEPGRSTRPGGTGLGLAISRLLARQLGGELALERTGPDGTSFQLRIPVAG